MAASFSLTMLGRTNGGDAYTLREGTGMLEDAGFSNIRAHQPPGLQTIIIASK